MKKNTVNLLRLGFVWTAMTQTANALSLMSSFLDYGEFALALVGVYRRIQKPIFEWLTDIGSFVGINLSLVHLDIFLFYVLLSANVYLAIPLALKDYPEFIKKTRPIATFRISLGSTPWWQIRWPKFWTKVNKIWTPLISRISEHKSHADSIGAPAAKTYSAILVYCVIALPFVALGTLVLLSLHLFFASLYLFLTLFTVILLCLEALIKLFLLPLFPFVAVGEYAYREVKQIRGALRTESGKVDLQQSGRVFRTQVLPWFIPLLTIIVGMFVVFTVDKTLDRLF